MATIAPISELDAVNTILRKIGEQPVNAITGTISPAVLAQTVLQETSRVVQAGGLYINTDNDYELTVDAEGNMYVPDSVLQINTLDLSKSIFRRGNRLYDLKNKTFNLTIHSPLKVRVVWFLVFDDLTEHAKIYITLKAARTFAEEQLGNVDITGLTEKDEIDAQAAFAREEHLYTRRTLTSSNLSLNQFVNRRTQPITIR